MGKLISVLKGYLCHCHHHHEWEEEYYGLRCKWCGMFVPDGMGPWMPMEDDYHV